MRRDSGTVKTVVVVELLITINQTTDKIYFWYVFKKRYLFFKNNCGILFIYTGNHIQIWLL